MLTFFHHRPLVNCCKYCFSSVPIDVNYIKLKKQDKNAEPNNLIIMHGLMGNLKNFHGLINQNQYLRNTLDIYLLDARNHGASPWTETISYPEMADDIAHFIKKKELKNLFIMGHSMGAKALMTFICKHPELYQSIKGVIINDMLPVNFMAGKYTEQYKKQKQFFEKLANLKLNYFKNWVSLKKELYRICSSQMEADFIATNFLVKQVEKRAFYTWKVNIQGINRDFENLWKFVPSYSIFDNKTRYNKPFQIIFGSESHLTKNIEDAKQFKLIFDKELIDDNLIVVQDAAHWVHFDQPKQFLNIVQQFIKQNI